jgi:hypothetical protein
MAKREVPRQQIQYPSEFEAWLKSKNVKRRDIRRNPHILDSYHQEWLQATAKRPRRRRSLFGMFSKMDLGQISNNLNRASEMIGMFQGLKGMMGPRNHQRDE